LAVTRGRAGPHLPAGVSSLLCTPDDISILRRHFGLAAAKSRPSPRRRSGKRAARRVRGETDLPRGRQQLAAAIGGPNSCSCPQAQIRPA
jgi:hypothetical protein